MIERERIEQIVKSNVGTLITAEIDGDVWRCHLQIPKNVTGRLSSLKSTFPNLEVVKRDGSDVHITIPVSAQKPRRRARSSSAAPERAAPKIAPSSNRRAIVPTRSMPPILPQSWEPLLFRLSELYETFFDEPGEVLRIDDSHYKLTFAGDMNFPFEHPFMSLLTAIIPYLTPVAVSTEHYGLQKRTSIYLSTSDERPRAPENGIVIYIDGSYQQGVGAYGVCYYKGGHPSGYLVGALQGADNNGAELMAFLQAIAHLDSRAQDVTIFTDSMYVTEWAANEGREWMERAQNRHIRISVQLVKRDANPAAHALAYNFLMRLFM
ncbi:MAG: RNase H family protein [Chloroflexota bacterium]|nr:RNase H family protein [Chloroflexota bacterium]